MLSSSNTEASLKPPFKVVKRSRKPFKSGEKIATVKDIIVHPITGNLAYTFYEDESFVEVRQCVVYEV